MRKPFIAACVLGLGVPTITRAEAQPLHLTTPARSDLVDLVNQFIDAVAVRRDPLAFPGATQARWTENGLAVPAGGSLLKTVSAISYREIFVDTRSRQAGFYGVAIEARGDRAIFFVRLKATRAGASEVELVYTREGEASLFRPETMQQPDPLFEAPVPLELRTRRKTMIAAAQAYYDGIETADGSRVPASPGCYRVENGVDTHVEPTMQMSGHCNAGLHQFTWIRPVRNRRYPIVDEERGLIWAIVVMDIVASDGQDGAVVRKARSIIAGELFKVVAGRTRRMEVVMRNVPAGRSSGWPAAFDP